MISQSARHSQLFQPVLEGLEPLADVMGLDFSMLVRGHYPLSARSYSLCIGVVHFNYFYICRKYMAFLFNLVFVVLISLHSVLDDALCSAS